MNKIRNIRNFFRRESPIKGNTIMCRAGSYTHKKNIQTAFWIVMFIGIIVGRVISKVNDDVIHAIGIDGLIYVLISGFICGFIYACAPILPARVINDIITE